MAQLTESSLLGAIVIAVMVGLLGWMAWASYELSVQQAVITTEVRGVKELIEAMQNNYITRAEAEIKFEHLQAELTRMRDSLRALALRDGVNTDGPDQQ